MSRSYGNAAAGSGWVWVNIWLVLVFIFGFYFNVSATVCRSIMAMVLPTGTELVSVFENDVDIIML